MGPDPGFFIFFPSWLELMWTRTELARGSEAVVLCALSSVVKLAQGIPAPNCSSLLVSLFPGMGWCVFSAGTETWNIWPDFSKKLCRKLPINSYFPRGRLLLVSSVAPRAVRLEELKDWGAPWWEQGTGIQLFGQPFCNGKSQPQCSGFRSVAFVARNGSVQILKAIAWWNLCSWPLQTKCLPFSVSCFLFRCLFAFHVAISSEEGIKGNISPLPKRVILTNTFYEGNFYWHVKFHWPKGRNRSRLGANDSWWCIFSLTASHLTHGKCCVFW